MIIILVQDLGSVLGVVVVGTIQDEVGYADTGGKRSKVGLVLCEFEYFFTWEKIYMRCNFFAL